jgi:hypothetical protein
MSDILQTPVCTYLKDRKKGKFKMKIRRKLNGWVAATVAAALLTGSSVIAADGDPDAKQEVRAVAAISKLKKLENISLFYVKGMT